jgi:hypothetical protein
MLMTLCGLISYMVTRKFFAFLLVHEFCDIVVQWCFFTCEMMMLNFVI